MLNEFPILIHFWGSHSLLYYSDMYKVPIWSFHLFNCPDIAQIYSLQNMSPPFFKTFDFQAKSIWSTHNLHRQWLSLCQGAKTSPYFSVCITPPMPPDAEKLNQNPALFIHSEILSSNSIYPYPYRLDWKYMSSLPLPFKHTRDEIW